MLSELWGFFGGSKPKATWDDIDIAVCTIEKVGQKGNVNISADSQQANALVNTAIEDLSIGKLGVVVMDELHMIEDESRGYILELMATKLLSLEQEVQIIGGFSQEDAPGTCPSTNWSFGFTPSYALFISLSGTMKYSGHVLTTT